MIPKTCNLSDVICSLKILAGEDCNYEGPDINSDGVTGFQEVIGNLKELAR